jgi:putative heme iron utilization protein
MSALDQAQVTYEGFIESFRSAILATVSAEGAPDASYAPFVADAAKNFYIFVSGLSSHTVNLSATQRASILFIDDEAQTTEIFARRRLSYDCVARLLPRDTPEWEAIADQFQQKFGDLIETLRNLSDFRIYQLTPESGRFVLGFGQAYQIDGKNLGQLKPVRGR